MRESDSLLPVVFAVVTGFAVVAMVLLQGGHVSAAEVSLKQVTLKCSLRGAEKCTKAIKATTHHRKIAEAKRSQLTKSDQMAALRSVQFALSTVSDGATYIWNRGNGRISSVVRPTESFKDSSGKVCRHLVVKFMSGNYVRSVETVACRRFSGVWVLSG